MTGIREITLSELASKLNLDLVGDGNIIIRGIASPEDGIPDRLCVIWSEKSLPAVKEGVPVLGKKEFFREGRPGLVARDPRSVLPALLSLFEPAVPSCRGTHPSAVVAPDAQVSPDAFVGPCCVVESEAVIEGGARLIANVYVGRGARVGAGSVLEPHTTLMYGTRVGRNCLLHAGCVLGCDGFGFLPSPSGPVKIPQIGGVVVEDDVEIGACTAIDRGTMGDTVIGRGTKIDNHVQIGHNVRVGKNCILCSMSGIGGSSVIEDGVTVSVQVGITDHVRIGKGALLGGRTGATNDIPEGAVVSGFPARPHGEARKNLVLSTRLPELYERVRRLERQADAETEKRAVKKGNEKQG